MDIISNKKIDLSKYGKSSTCDVYCIHVRENNIQPRAKELIKSISDVSWVNKLDIVTSKSYLARAEPTIIKLVEDIFNKVDNALSKEFGEYLISFDAVESLVNIYNHIMFPLPELWKEKVTGNPGFDFHSQSPSLLIAFGESKYNSKKTPHGAALNQIKYFIGKNKDIMDLVNLKNFADKKAINNAVAGKKAFVAAFSLNSENYNNIFDNAINSNCFNELLIYPELYLIGVEICQ